MLTKPGWIIFLLTTWFLMQLVVTVGNAYTYNQDTYSTTGETYANGEKVTEGLGGSSPILHIIQTVQGINSLSGAIFTDWGGVLKDLWNMLTFQASFLTGTWFIVRVFLCCISAGLGLSILFTFAPGALNAIASLGKGAVGAVTSLFK